MSKMEGEKKPYQPTEEEMKTAESMLTEEMRETSKYREKMLQLGSFEELPDGSIQIDTGSQGIWKGSPEEALRLLDEGRKAYEKWEKLLEKDFEQLREDNRSRFESIRRNEVQINELIERRAKK